MSLYISTASFLWFLMVDFVLFIVFILLVGTKKKICMVLSLPVLYFAIGFSIGLFYYYPLMIIFEFGIVIFGVFSIISANSSPTKNISVESSKEPIKAIASDIKPQNKRIWAVFIVSFLVFLLYPTLSFSAIVLIWFPICLFCLYWYGFSHSEDAKNGSKIEIPTVIPPKRLQRQIQAACFLIFCSFFVISILIFCFSNRLLGALMIMLGPIIKWMIAKYVCRNEIDGSNPINFPASLDPIALKNLQVDVLTYGIHSLYLRMMNSKQYQKTYSFADRQHAIIRDLNIALREFGYSL